VGGVGLQFAVEAEGPGWFRVSALRGDERVSWLHVVELDVHYGASKVRVGGVAGVYTPREHRGRGYSAATLRYAVQWMRERGYPLTALFGIPEYYHRFGYATFMGEHTVTLSLRSASRVEAEELDWEISDDQGAWRGEISRIYEAVNTLWPGARVRDPSSWEGFRKGVSWEHPAKPLVLKRSGRVVAYAALERWPSPEELLVAEVGAEGHDPELYRSLIKVLCSLALQERKSHIKVHAPPDHPFAKVARAYGCTVESFYPWGGGGMARVLRLKELLEAAAGELERRAAELEGEVSLRVEGEAVTLRVRRGSVKVEEGATSCNLVELGPGEAAQLFMGFRSAEELLPRAARGQAGFLAQLFPEGHPYVWQPDRW
jgi:predicted acetyltransferase